MLNLINAERGGAGRSARRPEQALSLSPQYRAGERSGTKA